VAACHSWHDSGLPLAASINLSPTSLGEEGLAERILAHITRHDLET
jgi:EAL domain-containing protein (putative c-di-GMP-specific phosphodiesterase class I)